MDKFEKLKKEILEIKKEVEQAIDNDHEVCFMGNGCNPCEIRPVIKHLIEKIEKLEK